MQLIQIVFFCHCLSPLEIDLMDSVEVFLEYFQVASVYLSISILWLLLLLSIGFVGAMSFTLGRLLLSQISSAVVCLGLVCAWLTIG